MSYMIEHAKREFALAINGEMSEEQKMLLANIIELMNTFNNQGHSMQSAPEVIRMFAKLAMFEPITALTGDDNEWKHVAAGVRQNIRFPRVFSRLEAGGWRAYDSAGKVFRDKEGVCYNSSKSMVPVEFPYTPVTEYIDVLD